MGSVHPFPQRMFCHYRKIKGKREHGESDKTLDFNSIKLIPKSLRKSLKRGCWRYRTRMDVEGDTLSNIADHSLSVI